MVRRRTARRKKFSGARRVGSPLRALDGAPARRGSGWLVVVLGALVLVNLYVFVWDKHTGVRAIRERAEAQGTPAMIPGRPLDAPADAGATPRVEPHAAPARGAPAAAPITGTVGKSDTLGRLLKRHGLRADEADEVIRALSGVLDFRTIRAGEHFEIQRGADGRVQRFELEVSKSHHVRAVRQPSGALVGSLVAT